MDFPSIRACLAINWTWWMVVVVSDSFISFHSISRFIPSLCVVVPSLVLPLITRACSRHWLSFRTNTFARWPLNPSFLSSIRSFTASAEAGRRAAIIRRHPEWGWNNSDTPRRQSQDIIYDPPNGQRVKSERRDVSGLSHLQFPIIIIIILMNVTISFHAIPQSSHFCFVTMAKITIYHTFSAASLLFNSFTG